MSNFSRTQKMVGLVFFKNWSFSLRYRFLKNFFYICVYANKNALWASHAFRPSKCPHVRSLRRTNRTISRMVPWDPVPRMFNLVRKYPLTI